MLFHFCRLGLVLFFLFFWPPHLAPHRRCNAAATPSPIFPHLPTQVSLETCAVLCIKQRLSCRSFLYGTSVRTGECFLYGKTAEAAGDAFSTGDAAALHLLDFYEKKSAEECSAGQRSPTGAPSLCQACPKGTYGSADDRTSCILCPAGSTTDTTGATSSGACRELNCPAGSSGPDAQGDCQCPSGASCEGEDCQCQGSSAECSDPNGGIRYFAADSDDAACKEPVQPPSVDFVFTPMSGDQLYYNRQYEITWQASNGVANVQLLLYRMAPNDPTLLYFVTVIASSTPNDGSFLWTVPVRGEGLGRGGEGGVKESASRKAKGRTEEAGRQGHGQAPKRRENDRGKRTCHGSQGRPARLREKHGDSNGRLTVSPPPLPFRLISFQVTTARTDEYAVVVFHVPGPGEPQAPTHRNTGFFSIGPLPTGPCKEGTYSESGLYPCTLCPLGTYWKNSTFCQSCPPMTTSSDLGGKTAADCNVNVTNPLFNFVKTPSTFFAGSNAAGYRIEEADHKTVEECAQLCIDDAGCKAFDAGNPDLFQAGDCFLSYDSRDTLRASDVRSLDQLDLYEKKDIGPILDRFFTKQEGCYIKGNDDGGLYEVGYSWQA